VRLVGTGNLLSIKGEKKREREERTKEYHYLERRFGSFQRSIQLPAGVDPNTVDARFDNGVLTVKLAKRAEVKPKKIEVKTNVKK